MITAASPGSGAADRPSLLRGVRTALTAPAALIYLGGFLALFVWALTTTLTAEDASFAMIWPSLAALPLSFLPVPGPVEHPVLVFLPMFLGAVVNAGVIGWCHRVLRTTR
ncbi:SCO4225 family membrane protein [Streptomyces bohaiensis]|uniref:DUF2637 domain-containing protein n=1 Tax=Streptomyces bohaiensis TaxID=1431344 RepID=A0ABX1CGG6_9ACTN|nr:hypothetical protein [Streptomyces bohaiensis]NJQ15514.1 hypothetical protein [Streptomyces bohaiensis]